MNKKIILGGVSTLAAVSTTVAIAVPIVIYNKAKSQLANFVPIGGSVPSLSSKNQIKYVALGDSITAGYNGFKAGDNISYADFLASDFKKAGVLSDYKNYAVTGATVGDISEQITESQATNHSIADADVITVSLSSNDVMNGLRAFGIPYVTTMAGLEGKVVSDNEKRNGEFENSNLGLSGSDSSYLFENASSAILKALYTNKTAGALTMDDTFKTITPSLIKRSLMIFTRDLHQAAPNAHIKFIYPEFPLFGINQDFANGKIENLGKSLLEYYNEDLFKAVKEGTASNYSSVTTMHDGFASYISNAKQLKTTQTQLLKATDAQKVKVKAAIPTATGDVLKGLQLKLENLTNQAPGLNHSISFLNHMITDDIDKNLKVNDIIQKEFLPNVADIHPSVRGHEVFGNYLFNEYSKEISAIKDPVSLYTLTTPYSATDNNIFEEIDEIDWVKTNQNHGLLTLKDTELNTGLINTFNNAIRNLFAPHKDTEVFSKLEPLINTLVDKYLKPDSKPTTEYAVFDADSYGLTYTNASSGGFSQSSISSMFGKISSSNAVYDILNLITEEMGDYDSTVTVSNKAHLDKFLGYINTYVMDKLIPNSDQSAFEDKIKKFLDDNSSLFNDTTQEFGYNSATNKNDRLIGLKQATVPLGMKLASMDQTNLPDEVKTLIATTDANKLTYLGELLSRLGLRTTVSEVHILLGAFMTGVDMLGTPVENFLKAAEATSMPAKYIKFLKGILNQADPTNSVANYSKAKIAAKKASDKYAEVIKSGNQAAIQKALSDNTAAQTALSTATDDLRAFNLSRVRKIVAPFGAIVGAVNV